MNAFVASIFLETKTSMTRNILFVMLCTLLFYFSTFTDFPYAQHESEDMSTRARLLGELISWIILLAVFRRTVLRDLDDRDYFSQHPINYKVHFLGKCFCVCLLLILINLIDALINQLFGVYYGNSLGSFIENDVLENLSVYLTGSLFASGFILLLALFQPWHFALLIGMIAGVFQAIDNQLIMEDQVPFLSDKFQTSLVWAPVPWLLGMFVFEWKMTRTSASAKFLSTRRLRWLKKLHIIKLGAVVITLACLYFTIDMINDHKSNSPIKKLRNNLKASLRQLRNQESAGSRYFSFKFQKESQWLFEQLSRYADQEWQLLHKEFDMLVDEHSKINVFIKISDEHTFGSTRGSFVVINAETINSSYDKKTTLNKTFRHELAHVLINHKSDYQFVYRKNIFGDFFHEGLAELVERNWNTNNTELIDEAALHYKIYDQDLVNLIPKLGRFSEYDYHLNYSLGYVFWSQFVKMYGREKVNDFLWILGDKLAQDREYEGLQFLYHKASIAEIDLYKVFHATKKTLDLALESIDVQVKAQTQGLKNFKATRLESHKILIPYEFQNHTRAFCKFRKKDTLQSSKEKVEPWNYQGRIGGLCNTPENNVDELQLLIYFDGNIDFRSRWIDMPKL